MNDKWKEVDEYWNQQNATLNENNLLNIENTNIKISLSQKIKNMLHSSPIFLFIIINLSISLIAYVACLCAIDHFLGGKTAGFTWQFMLASFLTYILYIMRANIIVLPLAICGAIIVFNWNIYLSMLLFTWPLAISIIALCGITIFDRLSVLRNIFKR